MDTAHRLSSTEATTLFPYAEDEGLAAAPATIEDAAAEIDVHGAGLDAIRLDVESAHRPAAATTTGDLNEPVTDAAAPTSGRASQLLAVTLCASGTTRLFADQGVRAYNDKVDGLRTEYDERKAEIVAGDGGVDPVDYPDGVSPEDRAALDRTHAQDVDDARAEQVAELVRELQGRQEEYRADPLDSEAEVAATRLKEGPTDEVLKDLFSAGVLPSSTVDAFPDIHFAYDEIPYDLKDMSDEELAEYLLDHPDVDTSIITSIEEDRPEVIDLVGEKLAEQIKDTEIAWDTEADVLKELDTLLRTWQETSNDVTAAMYEHLGGEGTLDFLTKLDQITYDETSTWSNSLASSFRYGVQMADIVWDDEQRATFGKELGDALVESQTAAYEYTDAMAYLLDDMAYNTALLDPLGDRIESIDISEHSLDVLAGGLRGPANVTDALFSTFTNNGEAALNFFDDADRQEKYLEDRSYGSIGYENLMGALDAAATDSQNLNDEDRQEAAAGLVSSIAHYLGNKDEFLEMGGGGDGASHMAHILTTYMSAVDWYLEHDGETGAGKTPGLGDERIGQFENMPVFSETVLENLVSVAISNEEGMVDMRAGLSAYQQANLAAGIEDGYINQSHLDADARLEGFFIERVGETEIADAAKEDARVKAWIDLGKDIAGSIPLPGGKVMSAGSSAFLSFLSNQTVNATANDLHAYYETNTKEACLDAEEMAKDALDSRRIAIASVLYENEKIDVDELAESARAKGVSEEKIDEWFGSGDLPDTSDMSKEERQEYENTVSDVIEEEDPQNPEGSGWVDMGRYEGQYKDVFTDYFPEKGSC